MRCGNPEGAVLGGAVLVEKVRKAEGASGGLWELEGFPENPLAAHLCSVGEPSATSPMSSFRMGVQRPQQGTLKDGSEKSQWAEPLASYYSALLESSGPGFL